VHSGALIGIRIPGLAPERPRLLTDGTARVFFGDRAERALKVIQKAGNRISAQSDPFPNLVGAVTGLVFGYECLLPGQTIAMDGGTKR